MANNNTESADNTPDNSREDGSEKSFVGKFVSGFIKSTPLSKWFGKDSASRSVVRRRDEDEESDTSFSFQPPSKRAKLPTDIERNNYSAHVFESPVTVHNNVNSSSKVLSKFPEPLPGPSGIKTRKLFEKHSTSSTNTVCAESFENDLELVNGEQDSDSGESTSGYFSASKLVDKEKREDGGNKRETSDKPTPKTRSLFTHTNDSSPGRTLFAEKSPQMNTSLSSRRPAFNASTFGSPNFVDRTLSTKRIMNSPFYSGRTAYGGASAYGRQLGRNAEKPNAVARSFVQIKPVNEKSTSDNTTLSKTARRILSTLEQYSTPISDAKKIPVSPRKSGLLSSYVGATPYLVRDRKRASNKELQVPTVPELLQMKQKQRLQTSTETVRQIATKSKSSLNQEDYKLRTDDDTKQKHSNKMKSSVVSVRQKVQSTEPVDEVKLPKVSLPITTLPKFDFVLMPPKNVENKKDTIEKNKSSTLVKSPINTSVKPVAILDKKETETKIVNSRTNNYTFAEPLVILKDTKIITPINCFKFSKPMSQKDSGSQLTFKSGDSGIGSCSFKTKNNGDSSNFTGTVKPVNQLLTGSVMDVLGKKKEQSSASWECPTCLVQNKSHKIKCCACEEPKPEKEDKLPTAGFGDQFKLSGDKWECSSCLVRNENIHVKCVACGTERSNTNNQKVNDFGDKFKPPASTWECSSCLIRNKDELNNCAACGTSKLGKAVVSGFGDKFKPSGNTWECTACMIRNKNDADKCVACETVKPGAKPPSAQISMPFNTSGTTFNFGIKTEWECKTCMIKNKNDLVKCAACEMPRDGGVVKTGFGEGFKMKTGEWECSSCMVKNKPSVDVCVCCGVSKPGGSNDKLGELSKLEEKKPVISFNFGIDKAGASQFNFGIPSSSIATTETKNTVVSTPAALTFGSNATCSATTPSSFSFGITTQGQNAPAKVSESASPSVSTNPLLKFNEKLPEKATPAPAGFSFGLDNTLNKDKINEAVNSKTETTTSGALSTSFGSTPLPAFKFKPTAVNGDINKAEGGPSITDEKSKVSPFDKLNKLNESPFGGANNQLESQFSNKKTDSSFGTSVKQVDSSFGGNTKPTDSPFSATNKPSSSPFVVTSKPVESPFGANKLSESSFGGATTSTASLFSPASKPAESPFGTGVNKTAESPFGNVNKTVASPFVKPNDSVKSPFGKPSEDVAAKSPFGKPNESIKSPFSLMSKPTESPFAATSTNKPKESLFGPNTASSSQTSVFGGASGATKPSESLFSGDGNKPKEPLFGTKPVEASSLFPAPTSTPTFSFTPKPTETASTSFTAPATASQSPAAGIFKFGGSTSNAPQKRTMGETSSNNISNGFGSAAKVPTFGGPQSFGTPENKPFAFGAAETAPKTSGFSFTPTEKPNVTAPLFNFGSNAPSAPSGGFNFAAPSGGFNFGGAPKVESQPFSVPNNNAFGSGASAAKNGSFNFGTNANSNNHKAVFSFGANQTSQPAPSSFPAPAQAGFNFGTPGPSLNPPQPGAFAFTANPSITEGSSSQHQQRRIKRAVRRTTTR